MYICSMNQEQAIEILEKALNQAVEKGAYNLNEVTQIVIALQVIKETSTEKK